MKKLLIPAFCVVLTSCYNIERNCQEYRTGDFKFTFLVAGEEKTGTFTRKENLSIDYFEDKVDSSSVRWINDCEFILKKLNPTNAAEDDAIHMKIIETTDSSYTFEYKLAIKKANRPARVEKGVAYRVN